MKRQNREDGCFFGLWQRFPVVAISMACTAGMFPGGCKESRKAATHTQPTCEAAAEKLLRLSHQEGLAIDRIWSKAKQDRKRKRFIDRCTTGLSSGKLTRAQLACVLKASVLSEAQRCLRAP